MVSGYYDATPSRCPKAKDSSAARRAYEQLHHEIIECRLAPGEQLTEASAARRLGLGKTPVREALRHLMFEGLVLVAPRQGYYVAPLTIRDVDELFELRHVMESAAAKLGPRITIVSREFAWRSWAVLLAAFQSANHCAGSCG